MDIEKSKENKNKLEIGKPEPRIIKRIFQDYDNGTKIT